MLCQLESSATVWTIATPDRRCTSPRVNCCFVNLRDYRLGGLKMPGTLQVGPKIVGHADFCFLGSSAFGSGIAGEVSAQCRPPATSHEARLLAFYEVPTTFSLGGAPERLPMGAVEVGAEATPVRSPNAALTHPQYCYQYTTNDTKLAPAFARPRIVIGLPRGLTSAL